MCLAGSVGVLTVMVTPFFCECPFWTDGSLVEDKVSGASSAGAGCFNLSLQSSLGTL